MKATPIYPYRKRAMSVMVRGPLVESETVTTAHGDVIAAPGDFVITDPRNGDQWPIKQHFLAANYEPIDPNEEARFRSMRSDLAGKVSEIVAIVSTRGTGGITDGVMLKQVDNLVVEYGHAQRRAGAESIAGQMRSSFLALGDEVTDMQKAGAVSQDAAERMTTNIRMLIELFAPASDTRRAIFGGYQVGHQFDWEGEKIQ